MESTVTSSTNEKWFDEDDINIKIDLNSKNYLKKLKKDLKEKVITAKDYQQRIREYYKEMNQTSELFKWAEQTEEQNEDKGELDNLLTTNVNIINEKKILNQTNQIKISMLTPITKAHQHQSITTSINFHPKQSNIAITTGLDKKMQIFNIISEENKSELIKTINTLDMPITSAHFLNDNEVILTGRRKHYFIYDFTSQKVQRFEGHFATTSNMITSLEKCFVGPDSFAFGDQRGNVYLYETSTKRFKYDIKLHNEVNSICFDSNGINLYIAGDQSEIYLFDMRKYRECVNKINDFGNYCVNCMDISKDNSYLSTGSKNGYVNVYSVDDIRNCPIGTEDVEPLKSFDNLTTSCDNVKFNKSSTVLGMSSKWKQNALRLVNLQTMQVYQNFPGFKARMKYPTCLDFNCDDSYLSIGNDEGKAFLYKIDN